MIISQTEVPRLKDEMITIDLEALRRTSQALDARCLASTGRCQFAASLYTTILLSECRIPSETWMTWSLRIGRSCGVWKRAVACRTGLRWSYRHPFSRHIALFEYSGSFSFSTTLSSSTSRVSLRM